MNVSVRGALPVLVLSLLGYILFKVHDVLLPFVLAATLAYLMNPMVRFFEVRGLRRGPVVILLYLSLVLLLSAAVYELAGVAASEAQQAAAFMPAYVQKGGESLSTWQRTLNAWRNDNGQSLESMAHRLASRTTILDYVANHGKEWPQEILTRMPSFAMGALPMLELLFLAPFLGFFFLKEVPAWRAQLVQWVPARYVEMTINLFFELDNSLGRYVRGVLLEAFLVGCLAFCGFWLIDLDYALQVAMAVGFASVVPYVGPVIGILIGGSLAIFQWGTFFGFLKVVAVCVTVRFIEDWFIQPAVLQKAVHLHPVIVVFALMAGTHLFGFWGLLFAVPVACVAKVLLEVLWPWYWSQYGYSTAATLRDVRRIPLI